jgi:hypothetical protein
MNSRAWISLLRISNQEESEMKKVMVFLVKSKISVFLNKEKEIGKMLSHAILNHHNLIFGAMQIIIFLKLQLNKLNI